LSTLAFTSPQHPETGYPPLPEIDMSIPPSRLTSEFHPTALPEPADPIPLPDPAWRIGVVTDGLYALDYATLNAAGVPVATTDPNDYRLFWRGQEVALDASDVGATFDVSEAFYFYGEKFHGSTQDEKYTDENVYWLTVDASTPGLRMSTRDVTPDGSGAPVTWYTETVHIEENKKYWGRYSTSPGTDATWFWEESLGATKNVPATHTHQINLDHLHSSVYSAALQVEFAAVTQKQRQIQFYINDHYIGETSWSGRRGHTTSLHFSSTYLVDGANTLSMSLFSDEESSEIYLNWIKLAYRRQLSAINNTLSFTSPLTGTTLVTITGLTEETSFLYDTGNALRPTRLIQAHQQADTLVYSATQTAVTHYVATSSPLTPHTVTPYHLPADLLSPSEGADLIILTTDELTSTVTDLAQRRRDQGLRVKIVDVEDTYALFNGGVYHPEAIRSFVAYAYHHWPGPAPQYLLLFGDGNFNFKGYNPDAYGEATPSLIPPYLGFLDPTQGEVPVDTWYGDVTGNDLPELYVGRLAVSSFTQAQDVIDKLLAYEDQAMGEWATKAIFTADDDDAGEGFSAITDRLMEDYIPAGFTTQTVYLADYATVASTTHALTTTWNQGAALLTYIGHAWPIGWANEEYLTSQHLPTLQPTDRLPFLISLDCFDAFWFLPPEYPGGRRTVDTRPIGEWVTTVLTDRGAIANFGPAGLGFPATEEVMTRAMYEELFQHGETHLGPLTEVARDAASWSYMARTYTLLGDPSLVLHWWDHLSIEPASVALTVNTAITLTDAFTVTGVTAYSETFKVTPTWTSEKGQLDAWSVFTPTEEGQITVTAHLGQFSVPVTLYVTGEEPQEPSSVLVSPDPLDLYVGKVQQMTATVLDQWDNPMNGVAISWAADENIGTIDESGLFTASSEPTEGWITATHQTVNGHAKVTVHNYEIYLPLTLRN
jgi:hypothetical protein